MSGVSARSYSKMWISVWGLLLVSLLPALSIDLPLRWRWSSPTPHGNTVYDMTTKFGLAIQACEKGQIYSSYDLVLWEPLESGTTNSLRGLTFIGARLVVTGANGTILFADSLVDFQTASLNPPTSDWLEGVVAHGGVAVSVGDNGAIYSSTGGANWTRQNSGTAAWLSSVAVSPSGVFVAVGQGGHVSRSPDGVVWTQQTSNTIEWLNKVKWLNGSFWAAGENGTLLSSVNGVTWTPLTTGAKRTLFSGATNGNGYLFVGDEEVRTGSGFPLTWRDELDALQIAPPPKWTYFSALRFDPYYVIAGQSGMLVQGFNAGTPVHYWETHSDPIRNWIWDMTRLPDLLVAVGDFATVLTSSSGAKWDLELVPNAVTNSIFLGVGGDTNALISVGNAGSIIYSPSQLTNIITTNILGGLVTNEFDTIGTLWYAVEPRPTTNDLQGIAVLNDRYVAAGAGGTILTSDDGGTNWTAQVSPTTEFLSSIAVNSEGFVVVGNGGIVMTSADGVSWNLEDSGRTDWLFRVRQVSGQFFAVGENGTMIRSVDGKSWADVNTGTSKWLNDVVCLPGREETFFTVGNQGTVLASTNAVDWVHAGSITSKSLYAASHNGAGGLVVAGLEGAILRSQISPFTNEIQIVDYSRGQSQSSFLFSGATGQQFTLDRGQTFSNWVSGDILEFLDGTGTLLYIEPNATNPPPSEYYRAAALP